MKKVVLVATAIAFVIGLLASVPANKQAVDVGPGPDYNVKIA